MQKMPDLALFKKENIVFNYIKMCETKEWSHQMGGGIRVVLLLKWPYFC